MKSGTRQFTEKFGVAALVTTGCWRAVGILCMILAAAATVSTAQDNQASASTVTFTTLVGFDGTNGSNSGPPPSGPMVQSTNGNLYGTTPAGGVNGDGTVFKITQAGALTPLHSFDSTDGRDPVGALVQGADGNFYGTTQFGGAHSGGAVFKMTPRGALTTLYSFCESAGCSDGENPNALIQADDGNFYGTTWAGGRTEGTCFGGSCGTLFKMTPSGVLTTLYSFCSETGCTDGWAPTDLVQGDDGNLYGTTSFGGADNAGTVFQVTKTGTLNILHSFQISDGLTPNGVTQGSDGNLYGTTEQGGANNELMGGTVFSITRAGTFTLLYSFCAQSGCADGSNPLGTVVQGTDGNLYGTTAGGGANATCPPAGCGTVFSITRGGALSTLYNFCSQENCTDSSEPFATLVQDTSGSFYGTTSGDGNSGNGTVFSLSVGLPPFVETVPTSGKVGSPVKILGSNLTGATAVNFNGTAAVFKVVSRTLISATVPAGATTGFVTVTIPSGTLKSNAKFRVTQ